VISGPVAVPPACIRTTRTSGACSAARASPAGQVEPACPPRSMVNRRDERQSEPPDAEHAVAEPLVVVHDVELTRSVPHARNARTLNVRARGTRPPHIIATSSASAQSRSSRAPGVRNGSFVTVEVKARQRAQVRPVPESGVASSSG